MPLSSDELETIDVGVEMPFNPFVGMGINQILIEIVDNLNDESGFETPNRVTKCASVYMPLTDEDRRAVGLKFNLLLSTQTHKVNHFGIGEKLANPLIPFVKATANRACLFNTFSLLLTGRDTYSAIIRHVLCNYIENPVHFNHLQQYIPETYKSGKEYIVNTRM